MALDILTQSEYELLVSRKFKTNDFKIIDQRIELNSPDEKLGFMGDHLRIHFKILLQNKPIAFSLFLKYKLTNVNPMYKMMEDGKCCEREIEYLKLVNGNWGIQRFKPETQWQWAPILYHSKTDLFLILECMNSLNFDPARSIKRAEVDLDHTKCVIRSIAQMHAFSIILEEQKRSEIGNNYTLSNELTFIEPLFNRNTSGGKWVWQATQSTLALIDLIPEDKLAKAEFKRLFLRKMEDVYEIFLKPSDKFRNVLCHGDLWLNNFLFKYDASNQPIECCLVDFQFIRYLPPMHDVYFYLYINTTLEFRAQHSETVIRYYYESLRQSLARANLDVEKIFSWENFIESGREFEKVSKIIRLFYLQVHLLDNHYWELFLRDMKFMDDFVFLNRSKYVVESFEMNETYRKAMTEDLIDVRNMLLEEHN